MAKKLQQIGILTGGGDCPGLNPVIRAVVARATQIDCQVIGLRYGWKGLLEGTIQPLKYADVEESHRIGGTLLGSSRTNPLKDENGLDKCRQQFDKLKLDALIASGGEDTLGVAAQLAAAGLPVVGVPKTIDNDLLGTDFTFGFDTAVSIATDAIDRLFTTARSHERIMVLELMGRHAGWITAFAGIAGGADVVLTPEFSKSVAEVCEILKKKRARDKRHAIIVVAEGAEIPGLGGSHVSEEKDSFGHKRLGGIGTQLADAVKEKTGWDTRATVLGHIQRGGSPSAHDRVLATRYGLFAMQLVESGQFGKLAATVGGKLKAVDLNVVRDGIKKLPQDYMDVASVFSL